MEGMDTHLRTLEELIARLIRPIPANLIDKKPDKSKADYINITTVKDLLDVACGRGNWTASVVQMSHIPPNHLGMVVRLSINTADRGLLLQDGTGHEVTDDPKIYGDPLTNAYAQGLRRAAESFGMARELWRRETIGAQKTALQMVKSGEFKDEPPSQVVTAPDSPPVRAVPQQSEDDALDSEISTLLSALGKESEQFSKWVNREHGTKGAWFDSDVYLKRDLVKYLRSLQEKHAKKAVQA